MKSLVLISVICGCIFSPACFGTRDPNRSTPANAISPTPSPRPVDGAEPASTPRPDEVREGSDERFEGTAGITDKKPQSGETAILAAIRTGRHPDFDRIVFEFSNALPGYHIEYIDKPVRSCGSGEVVPLAGDGWLEVRMMPSAAHTEMGEPTVSNRSLKVDLPIVKELRSTCDFEADVTWVAGVSSPNRYRVLELSDPSRLVIDIKH